MHLIKILILSSVLALSGCATGCQKACVFGIGPGNPMFDSYANYSDERDPCQFKGKEVGYTLPEFCGASRGKNVRITKTGSNTYRVNQY